MLVRGKHTINKIIKYVVYLMLISAKRKSTEKDKGTVIFYRVSGKTSWESDI